MTLQRHEQQIKITRRKRSKGEIKDTTCISVGIANSKCKWWEPASVGIDYPRTTALDTVPIRPPLPPP
jgi:hypothetical protein